MGNIFIKTCTIFAIILLFILIFFTVCELLCDKDVTFDAAKAQYWTERASSMHPNSPIVFILKEKLISTNKNMNSEDFEKLFNGNLIIFSIL